MSTGIHWQIFYDPHRNLPLTEVANEYAKQLKAQLMDDLQIVRILDRQPFVKRAFIQGGKIKVVILAESRRLPDGTKRRGVILGSDHFGYSPV